MQAQEKDAPLDISSEEFEETEDKAIPPDEFKKKEMVPQKSILVEQPGHFERVI